MLHFVHQVQRRFPRRSKAIMIAAVVLVMVGLAAGIALALIR